MDEMRQKARGHGVLRTRPSADDDAIRDRAVRRIALFLHQSVSTVERNLPGALLGVLCRIPDGTPLRRSQDQTILSDVKRLMSEVEDDDLRRPRLKFLLEAADRRSRL